MATMTPTELKTVSEWSVVNSDPIITPRDNLQERFSCEIERNCSGLKFVPDVVFGPNLVGIEVEVEKVPALYKAENTNLFSLWRMKKDGTLRNHGMELISIPLDSARSVGAALTHLHHELEKGKLKGYDFSWRTSIHVHMSVLHFNIQSMANFSLVYPVVEGVLFEAFAPERKNSIFCVPFTETKMNWEAIHKILQEENGKAPEKFNFLSYIVGTWRIDKNKYGAVNFSRMGDLGTIEFRHLSGTDDFEKISSWVSCLTRLVTFCHMNSPTVVRNTLFSLIDPVKRKPFLKALFGAEAAPMLEFSDLLEVGLKRAVLLLDLAPKKNLMSVTAKGGFVKKIEKIKAKKLERAKRRVVSP